MIKEKMSRRSPTFRIEPLSTNSLGTYAYSPTTPPTLARSLRVTPTQPKVPFLGGEVKKFRGAVLTASAPFLTVVC